MIWVILVWWGIGFKVTLSTLFAKQWSTYVFIYFSRAIIFYLLPNWTSVNHAYLILPIPEYLLEFSMLTDTFFWFYRKVSSSFDCCSNWTDCVIFCEHEGNKTWYDICDFPHWVPIFRMEIRYRQAYRFVWLESTRWCDQLNLRRLIWIAYEIQFTKVETSFIWWVYEIKYYKVPFKEVFRIWRSNKIVLQSSIVLSHLFLILFQKHPIFLLYSTYTCLTFTLLHFYYIIILLMSISKY